MQKYDVIAVLLSEYRVDDLITHLVGKGISVTSISDKLYHSREEHIGCILSIQLGIPEEHRLHSDSNDYALIRDFITNFMDSRGMFYFSVIVVTGEAGSAYSKSSVPFSVVREKSTGSLYRDRG